MTRRLGWLIGALALGLWAWSPNAAQADSGHREKAEKHYKQDRDYRDYRGERGHAKHRHGHKRDRGYRARDYRRYGHPFRGPRYGGRGAGKYIYDDGYCRTTYKYGKHGSKYRVRCRDDDFRGRRSDRYERRGSGYGRGGNVIVIQPNYVAQTLDNASDGQSIVWNDSRERTQYEIVPTKSYQTGNGRYCREYLNTATVGGQSRQVYGQACRQEDGSWEIVR